MLVEVIGCPRFIGQSVRVHTILGQSQADVLTVLRSTKATLAVDDRRLRPIETTLKVIETALRRLEADGHRLFAAGVSVWRQPGPPLLDYSCSLHGWFVRVGGTMTLRVSPDGFLLISMHIDTIELSPPGEDPDPDSPARKPAEWLGSDISAFLRLANDDLRIHDALDVAAMVSADTRQLTEVQAELLLDAQVQHRPGVLDREFAELHAELIEVAAGAGGTGIADGSHRFVILDANSSGSGWVMMGDNSGDSLDSGAGDDTSTITNRDFIWSKKWLKLTMVSQEKVLASATGFGSGRPDVQTTRRSADPVGAEFFKSKDVTIQYRADTAGMLEVLAHDILSGDAGDVIHIILGNAGGLGGAGPAWSSAMRVDGIPSIATGLEPGAFDHRVDDGITGTAWRGVRLIQPGPNGSLIMHDLNDEVRAWWRRQGAAQFPTITLTWADDDQLHRNDVGCLPSSPAGQPTERGQ